MKDKRLFLYTSKDIQERFCHLIRVSQSLGNPYIACCPPSLMVSGGLYAITKKKLFQAGHNFWTTENSDPAGTNKLFDPILSEELLQRVDFISITGYLEDNRF
jgi:hypothetical protein